MRGCCASVLGVSFGRCAHVHSRCQGVSAAPITAITVDYKVGTRLALFSFDAPIVSFFQPENGPFNGQVRGMLLSGTLTVL